MKTKILVFSILIKMSGIAQDCRFYQRYIDKGDSVMNVKKDSNFQYALNAYRTALLLCPTKSDEVQLKIQNVFNMINSLKIKADSEWKRAEKLNLDWKLAVDGMRNEHFNYLKTQDSLEKSRQAAEVVKRLVDLQNTKIIELNNFYENEKKKVGRFLTDSWEPQFLTNFMKISNVMEILKKDSEPEKVISDFVDAARLEMNKQRAIMLTPLDEAMLKETKVILDAFSELIKIQNNIGGARGDAASKNSEQQVNLYINKKLGDISQNTKANMTNISSKVTNALAKVEKVDINSVLKTLTDSLK